jgi:uncharacterized membrane protein YfcA
VGSISYARRGLADVRGGVAIGLFGAAASVLGAYLSHLAGGSIVMIVTAAIIFYLAYDMAFRFSGAAEGDEAVTDATRTLPWRMLATIGVVTGVYSGFLGLGGGFILVPMLVKFGRYPIKKAIGTSLTAIAVLAIPGSLTHWGLGHVNVQLAVVLALGVVPGVLIGARLTAAASEHRIRLAFAVLLVLAGIALVFAEVGAF